MRSRPAFKGLLVSVAVIAGASSGRASPINIDSSLTVFAPGVLGTSGTPWIITQGSTTTAQIVSSTLSSPPGPGAGTSVAATTGGGNIIQDITSLDWQSNTNYTLDFFIGVPSGQAAPPTITVSLLYSSGSGTASDGLSNISGTINGASFTDQNVFGLTAATAGQWREYVLNFTTPTLAVGPGDAGNNPIAIDFRADGGSNDLVDWYVPAAVPGPVVGAGFPGLILAIAGLFACMRRRRGVGIAA
jgi:hypothetical protein